MEAILGFFQEFINLGAAILLPVVIAILGKFFGMKLGHAIKSGLLVGIGFQGLVLAVNLLITTIQPVMDYYKALGSGYDALEVGFAALGAASWTVPFAVFVIPAIIIVNLILVRLKITKVLNVDIWNFMHFLVPGICPVRKRSYRFPGSRGVRHRCIVLFPVAGPEVGGILRTGRNHLYHAGVLRLGISCYIWTQ